MFIYIILVCLASPLAVVIVDNKYPLFGLTNERRGSLHHKTHNWLTKLICKCPLYVHVHSRNLCLAYLRMKDFFRPYFIKIYIFWGANCPTALYVRCCLQYNTTSSNKRFSIIIKLKIAGSKMSFI